MPFYAQHVKAGRLHLIKNDPVLKQVIKTVGPFTARTKRNRFATLIHSIVAQQISVSAATTIRSRLVDATSPEGLTPQRLLKFDVDSLRAIGVSRQKATYVLDLAGKVDSGVINLAQIHRKNDEAVIEEMVQVKGIGRWTAQMFLMFSLGRMDVLPVDDLGLRNAIRISYQLTELPTKDEVERLAEAWRPFSTIASWYLWKSLEVDLGNV